MQILGLHSADAATMEHSQCVAPADAPSHERYPDEDNNFEFRDWVLFGIIICSLLLLLVFSSAHRGFLNPVIAEVNGHEWARLIRRPSILWVAMGTVLFLFRTICWFRYRPFASVSESDAPFMSVIIPAYNEGPMVLQSIESVANATYSAERLEILVVDDGSTDDTWRYIRQAAARYPDLVKPVRLPKNCGKRAALATGFNNARGDVFVTLDSDSVIERGALLALAGAFRSPKIGAVAGKVTVYNRSRGLIPRMLHVRYILAFDFLRAVESSYGNVYCCPGALTAYRASAVRAVLQEWLKQTFMGSPCTFGEDRAMTNLLLRSGYDTVYQRSAVVRTLVPITYSKLCKMFLRWDRSYVREELRFMRIVWTRPLKTRFIALVDRVVTNLRYPLRYVSLFLLTCLIAAHPGMLVRVILAIGVMSFVNTLYYLRTERSPDFVYGIIYSYFSTFTLFWIFPYAVFTVRARAWLTR